MLWPKLKTKPKTWNQKQGEWGEQEACRLLKKRAYRILEKRFRTRYGEIDIIALKNRILYFIEVKTRTQTHFGHPLESLSIQKIKHFRKSALCFLESHPCYLRGYDWEFLAIALELDFQSQLKIEVVRFWGE